jgi:hypothetical protein
LQEEAAVSEDRVLAKYLIETPHALEHAAAVMAGEQSSGTFVSVPGETQKLKERFGARKELPPRQRPGSWSLDDVMESLQRGASGK